MPTMVVVGQQSSHGGVVITGDPIATIDGKPVARIGDLHSCPLFYPGPVPHSVTPIVGGPTSNRALINGRPCAVSGDLTGCGAQILPGSVNATISG